MVKSNGAAVHASTKPGTSHKGNSGKGERDPSGKNQQRRNNHLNGKLGNLDPDGSEHRPGLGNPDESDNSERKNGRSPLGVGNNGSGNGDLKSRQQCGNRQNVQLPNRRLTLEMVGLDAVPVVWDRFGVGQLFKDTAWRSGGRWNAEYLFEKIVLEHMQLWLIIENKNEQELIRAALVTNIRPYENGFKACHIVAIVGEEPRAWIHLRSELEAWAKRSGCEAIETSGRLGWKRVIPDWKATHIFLEKKL